MVQHLHLPRNFLLANQSTTHKKTTKRINLEDLSLKESRGSEMSLQWGVEPHNKSGVSHCTAKGLDGLADPQH